MTPLKIADKIIIKPKSKNSFTFYLSNTLKIEKTFKKEEGIKNVISTAERRF